VPAAPCPKRRKRIVRSFNHVIVIPEREVAISVEIAAAENSCQPTFAGAPEGEMTYALPPVSTQACCERIRCNMNLNVTGVTRAQCFVRFPSLVLLRRKPNAALVIVNRIPCSIRPLYFFRSFATAPACTFIDIIPRHLSYKALVIGLSALGFL